MLSGCRSAGEPAPSAASEAARLSPSAELRGEFWGAHDRELLSALELSGGARILDAGCGRGDHTLILADLVDSGGEVMGLDVDPEMVACLASRCRGTESDCRVVARAGDVEALPFDDGAFDLAWVSRVLHFMPDPTAVARELGRVVRPGGRVVVREDAPMQRLLPFDVGIGAPGLEDRVRATIQAQFAEFRAVRGRVARGWLGVLHDAGFVDCRARSFLLELQSPFTRCQADYLRGQILTWSRTEGLRAMDRTVLAELGTTGGPHDALLRDDLHFIHVSSVYEGKRT